MRPHIQTYAEDAQGYVEQTYQARRWLVEVDANFAGPMVRAVDGQDYYVHEPALATLSNHVEPVLPIRWFTRNGEYWAKAHRLIPNANSSAFSINGSSCLEIPLSEFKISMKRLEVSYNYHELPPPHRLEGEQVSQIHVVPSLNVPQRLFMTMHHLNRGIFRVQTHGAPKRLGAVSSPFQYGSTVMTLPEMSRRSGTSTIQYYSLWRDSLANLCKWATIYTFYQPPTSLRHWNKQKALLICYGKLKTNLNSVQPLIITTTRNAQSDGIAAWDCLYDEEVLLLPWAHAFQGDNPMQSEFASHIGMSGRNFCRVCNASGADAKSRAPGPAGEIEKVTEFMKVRLIQDSTRLDNSALNLVRF